MCIRDRIPTITGADALTGTANFTYDGNTLDVKNSGTASSINLYCETSNLHYVKIKSGPHAAATSYTLTLPNAPPSVSGQALTATTAGVGSWATVGGALTSFKMRFQNNASPLSVSDATNTKVTVDTVDWDTASGADTANKRWVCPAGEAGNYIFSIAGYIQDMSNAFAVRGMLYKNGTYSMGTDSVGQPRGAFTQINTGSTHMHYYMAQGNNALALAVGDYVETWIFGDWGSGSKNCTYGHLIGTKVS